MKFDNLSSEEKNRVLNKLCKFAQNREKIKSDIDSLKVKTQELKNKSNTNNSIGCFLFVMLLFIGELCPMIFRLCASNDKLSPLYEENPLLFLTVFLCFIVFLSIIIWLIISNLTGYRDSKRAKKQLTVLKEKLNNYNKKKDNIDSDIKALCNQFSIPSEAITINGLLYVKELVEIKKFDYQSAFSLCLKKSEQLNRTSLAEISKKLSPNKTQKGSILERIFLSPIRFIFLFQFKFLAALLGATKEDIEKKQKARYYRESLNELSNNTFDESSCTFNDLNNNFEEHKYTFTDKNGNLCESGGLFYDGKGYPRQWGDAFYDGAGNYVEWGMPFYDGKGYYCLPGNPFHDWNGNLINPRP